LRGYLRVTLDPILIKKIEARAYFHLMKSSRTILQIVFVLVLLGIGVIAQESVMLVGAGSTLPAPLYASWTEAYNQRNPNLQVRYVPMSTKEGINQITHAIGDFGAGEVPLSDEQLHGSRFHIVHVPTVLVGVVPIYNLPGVAGTLKFSGPVLADIFMGRIKNWNDPKLGKLNPEISLPSTPVKIVHRGEGKGTNYILTDYLSKVSSTFQAEIGRTASPKWPQGSVIAQRSEDMVSNVKSLAGSIGYVELDYALRSGLTIGMVQNAAGEFVKASPQTISAALKDKAIPSDFRVSITNAPGKEAYPISSFTWLYIPGGGKPERIKAMKTFLDWAMHKGQEEAQRQGYAPLPASLIAKVETRLNNIQ
jgi:phosphate transport system substrate-binding protein